MTDYAIGDVQGCDRPLERLLDAIRFDPAADRLWFCGDLVNRGGHSLQVLRRVYALRRHARVVLGNHDLHLLAYARGSRHRGRANAEFDQVLAAADAHELIAWLGGRPVMIHDPGLGIALVHAGLLPDWDLERALALAGELEAGLSEPGPGALLDDFHGPTPPWDDSLTGLKRLRAIAAVLTRIRFCTTGGRIDFDAKGPPGTQPPGYYPWFQVPGRRPLGATVVCGHWAALGYYCGDGIVALDSGCVWGGSLTAVNLSRPQRPIQVPGAGS